MQVLKKVLIVEDEVLIAYHIAELLKSNSIDSIEFAHSFDEAVEKVNNLLPQLVILDINLNSAKGGIDFAEFLNTNASIDFIFLTANTDLKKMSEAITKKPFAILTKPIKKIDLISNVSLFFNSQKNKDKKFIFKSKGKTVHLLEDEILYVKTESNYLLIFTKKQRYTIRLTICGLMKIHQFEHILQTHRSYLVNMKYVHLFENNLLFIGDEKIPVSRSFKADIIQFFSN